MPPKRSRIQCHASDEVQGEGSWVTVAALTVKEMRAYRARVKEKDFDAFEAGVDVLKTHVYKWNWVDDEGEPLPQPEDDPSVIDELSDAETEFLGACIQGSEAKTKN